MTAIAQHYLLDIADAKAVDENEPRGDLVSALHRFPIELSRFAIFEHENPILVDARFARDVRVLVELAVLAMHGDEVARAHRVDHFPQLVPLSVTGYMNLADLRIKDVSSVAVEVVHGLLHHALVARDRSRRDDDPVAPKHVHHRMTLGCKTSQRGHRLALAAGGQQQQLGRRDLVGVLELHGEAFGHLEEAKLAGGLEVRLQASAHYCDLAFELHRHADEMLDAVDVGREVGDHDATRRSAEDALEGCVQVALGS